MIKNAKVSLAAVRMFRSSVKDVSANSEKFTRGITCLEQMREELYKVAQELQDKLEAMQSSKDILQEKINSLEEIISELQAQIDALEIEVSSLESELSSTSSSITVPSPDGDIIDIPNPKYAALEAKISVKEGAIGALKTKLLPHQRRLEKARLLEYKLSMHMEKVHGNVYSLEEKKRLCKQLVSELTEAKKSNSIWCMNAIDGLTNIERVVNSYIRIKMKYETSVQSNMQQNPSKLSGINITINIHKPVSEVVARNEEQTESLGNRYNQEEIDKHRIKFDEFNRVCEYDGRKYGGKYVSYEKRLIKSMANNPVLGRYVGERGESKFIPSNRSAEGIVVLQILSERGLDGIEYRNAEPEFETCADAIVKIKGMTGDRDVNFPQADEELAKIWNFEERDSKTNWTARDVYKYRKANKLTWHEKCDMETMVLVRTEINEFFKHSGGCAECNARDAYNEGDDFDE